MGDGRGMAAVSGLPGTTSLTAGTIFEGTRKPLRMSFLAMSFVTSQKNRGQCARPPEGIGAWQLRNCLDLAAQAAPRSGRAGTCCLVRIEVDETYVGGPEQGTRGRETESKAIVAIAVEKNGRGLWPHPPSADRRCLNDSLLPFVQGAVERGAMVHADGWRGYARTGGGRLPASGHGSQRRLRPGARSHAARPPRRLAAQAMAYQYHQGGVQHQHLDYYLDEFTFRFNRRRSKARGLLFHRLAQQALAVGPAPYNAIVKPPGSSNSRTTGR